MTIVIDKKNHRDFELSLMKAYMEAIYIAGVDSLDEVYDRGSKVARELDLDRGGDEVVRNNLLRSVRRRMEGDPAVEQQFIDLVAEMLQAEVENDHKGSVRLAGMLYEWYSDMRAPRQLADVALDSALMEFDWFDEDEQSSHR